MSLKMFLHKTSYSSSRIIGLIEELTTNGANVVISGSDVKAGIMLVAELCSFISLRRNTRILLDNTVSINTFASEMITTNVKCVDSNSEYKIETVSKGLLNLLEMDETLFYY